LHKKKYFTLLPPFFILGIILAFTLSNDEKTYILLGLIAIAFWITYYVWIYIEKQIQKKNE
jgi:Ca2+/Na+ antiporter